MVSYMYINISEVGGSETNREIDFGFGSCVRARALVVRWEFGQILTCPLSLFPFLPFSPSGPFPFSLFSQRFCWQANHAVCNQHEAEYSKVPSSWLGKSIRP